MKTNIILFALVVFIISLIITLNIFFQQSYQSEMAEQFNRQQLIIAKSIAKSIEDEIQHIEAGHRLPCQADSGKKTGQQQS